MYICLNNNEETQTNVWQMVRTKSSAFAAKVKVEYLIFDAYILDTLQQSHAAINVCESSFQSYL